MDRIAVLIPCFNEERTIGKVVTDFKKTLPDAAVYVYDNNSNDRTAAVARDAGAIVRKETLQGKGNVIRRMFREVDAECYIMADGDDTYPAEAAIEMVNRVLEGQADMVVGIGFHLHISMKTNGVSIISEMRWSVKASISCSKATSEIS